LSVLHLVTGVLWNQAMNPDRSELDNLLDHVEKAGERYQATLAGLEPAIPRRDGPSQIHGTKQSTNNQTAAREELVLAIKAYTAATQAEADTSPRCLAI
jgi:hypothetical protein